MNARTVMVMYLLPADETTEQKTSQYPNAFIVQTQRELTPALLAQNLPRTLPPHNHLRFAVKSGEQTFWLDLPDDQPVPFYSENTIYLQLSSGVQ